MKALARPGGRLLRRSFRRRRGLNLQEETLAVV